MNETLHSRTAFVTGGSGFVGGRLISRLVAEGWSVKALARSPGGKAAVAAVGAVAVAGELNNVAALRSGMTGCDVVFHVAAHFKLWGPRKDFDDGNVGGMRALLDAAVNVASVRRIVAVNVEDTHLQA